MRSFPDSAKGYVRKDRWLKDPTGARGTCDGSGELLGRSHKVLVWRGHSPGVRVDDEAVVADDEGKSSWK